MIEDSHASQGDMMPGPLVSTDAMPGGAQFSLDRRYRYRLWRHWGQGPMLIVIGLNPSTADEVQLDPTCRRCVNYARLWGFGGYEMLNVFAYRATDPKAMKAHYQQLRPSETAKVVSANLDTLHHVIDYYDRAYGEPAVLAAWGAHARYLDMDAQVRLVLHRLGVGVACLGRTKDGAPRHPLYMPGATVPEEYMGNGGRLCGRERTSDPR